MMDHAVDPVTQVFLNVSSAKKGWNQAPIPTYFNGPELQDGEERRLGALFVFLEPLAEKRDGSIVIIQEIAKFAICLGDGAVICGKAYNSV